MTQRGAAARHRTAGGSTSCSACSPGPACSRTRAADQPRRPGRAVPRRTGPARARPRGRLTGAPRAGRRRRPLARRRRRVVQVVGAGRVGAAVVTLLASAGVGVVVVEDAGITAHARRRTRRRSRAADVGVTPRRTPPSAPRAGSRLRCGRRCRPAGAAPDLAVLAAGAGVDPAICSTGCCAPAYRTWSPGSGRPPASSARWCCPAGRPASAATTCTAPTATRRGRASPPSSPAARGSGPRPATSVLATAVAAHAALQVLAYLDGDPAPPAVDGTLEIAQADGRVRRRSLGRRTRCCGCRGRRHPAPTVAPRPRARHGAAEPWRPPACETWRPWTTFRAARWRARPSSPPCRWATPGAPRSGSGERLGRPAGRDRRRRGPGAHRRAAVQGARRAQGRGDEVRPGHVGLRGGAARRTSPAPTARR